MVDKLTPEGRRFMKELQELGRLQVRVGFQAGKGKDDDGVDYCDIAAWNELGTDPKKGKGIPSRPFMRDSIDKHEDEINAMLGGQVELLKGGVPARQILHNIGMMQVDRMQMEIVEGNFVPNAKSTIRKKKSDKPLVDTGRMRQSIHYVICKKGEYG